MKKMQIYGLVLTFLVSIGLCAQKMGAEGTGPQLTLEKTVELTGKSKNKGYLAEVRTDDAAKKFEMIFVTKSTKRKVKLENYVFDYDFNLVSNTAEEIEVERVKEKTKKVKYRGEDVEIYYGATAGRTMMGKLVLKKIQSIYTYNWWKGRYEIETKVLDKEKPKEMDQDGDDKKRKLYYISHREVPMKGEVLVCALVNKGNMVMYKDPKREYLIMKVDKELNITKKPSLIFDNPQSLVYSAEIEGTEEWVMIFCPAGGPGLGKVEGPDPVNYTYVKLDKDGNLIERVNFKSKCNEWGIMELFVNGNDVYFYGGGNIDKPEKNFNKIPFIMSMDAMAMPTTNEQRVATLEQTKIGYIQIVKIAGGKAEFVSAVGIDEINANGVKPPSQKKLKEFDGKRFTLNKISVTSRGDIFISGQDFKMDKVGDVQGRVYKDIIMFQFDNKGAFKKFYGIENIAKGSLLAGAGTAKSFPAESQIIESPDGKSLVWNIFMTKDIDVDCESSTSYNYTVTTCTYTPLFQGRLAKINIANSSISDLNEFGGEDFYLYTDLGETNGVSTPWFTINNNSEIIYVGRSRKGGIKGSERWGSQIWFGKLNPSKI